MSTDSILIWGAREPNPKNSAVELPPQPTDRLRLSYQDGPVVVDVRLGQYRRAAPLRGPGLCTPAAQMDKPEVDFIDGLSPGPSAAVSRAAIGQDPIVPALEQSQMAIGV